MSVALAAMPALAMDPLIDNDAITLTPGIELGASTLATSGNGSGFGGPVRNDADWVEGYVKPSLDLEIKNLIEGMVYAGVSAVAAITEGDGDLATFTDGGDDGVNIEKAVIGLTNKSGEETEPADKLVYDLSFGRQDVHIGDGWLIWDGNFDTANRDAAYWIAPRTVFTYAGVAEFAYNGFGLKSFVLQGDRDQARTEMYGGDVSYMADWGGAGITLAHVFDDDGTLTREGLDIVSVRVKDLHLPSLEDLKVSGEYTDQSGKGSGVTYDNYGFYGQAAYTFSSLPWSPTLSYRYSEFSEFFDPLFYGASGGWGTFYLGEIAGEYFLFNNNQRTHMVKLAVAPREDLELGAIYYNHALKEDNFFGAPVTSRDFADEINVYADWTVNDQLFVSALVGVSIPGEAMKQAIGNDTVSVALVYATFTY